MRDALTRLVEERPGITLGEAKESLGVGWGTMYHHVDRLLASGVLRSQLVGRRRILYLSTASSEVDAAVRRALVLGDTTRRLLREIMLRPGRSILELCEATGVSPRAAYYHVKRLVEADLLVAAGPWKLRDLRPTDALVELWRAEEDAARTVPATPDPEAP